MSFHFIKLRKIWYLFSLAVIIPGLISLAVQGLNRGIDFTGGSLVEVRFAEPTPISEVRGVVEAQDLASAKGVQKSGATDFLIRTRELSEQESATLISNLEEKVGPLELLRNDRVGPVISRELMWNAIWALSIAAVLILIYISFRFEFKQGVAAIVAIIHDILVVLGLFSLLQLEVNSAFVAAMLTIIGYSINDTIIIFDRVRENLRSVLKKELVEDLVNMSLWQTLVRSLNTVLTVVFVLVALLVLGGSTIHNFVLAMLIGVISGAYSSIFVAGPVWVELKLREKGPSLKAKEA